MNVPIQFGKLLSHVFRSVQINVRLFLIESGKTNDGSHRNLIKLSAFDIKRPFFGADGSMHPCAV